MRIIVPQFATTIGSGRRRVNKRNIVYSAVVPEANMTKLKTAGYQEAFYSLESGIDDYVRNYLAPNKFY